MTKVGEWVVKLVALVVATFLSAACTYGTNDADGSEGGQQGLDVAASTLLELDDVPRTMTEDVDQDDLLALVMATPPMPALRENAGRIAEAVDASNAARCEELLDELRPEDQLAGFTDVFNRYATQFPTESMRLLRQTEDVVEPLSLCAQGKPAEGSGVLEAVADW